MFFFVTGALLFFQAESEAEANNVEQQISGQTFQQQVQKKIKADYPQAKVSAAGAVTPSPST